MRAGTEGSPGMVMLLESSSVMRERGRRAPAAAEAREAYSVDRKIGPASIDKCGCWGSGRPARAGISTCMC